MEASSCDIKRLLIQQIASGRYAVGTMLPSCRDLAIALGINRNTANKIYQELAREGFVKALRGRGFVVIAHRGCAELAAPSLRERMLAVGREAKLMGMERHAFLQMATDIADDLFARRRPSIAFVECNEDDGSSLSKEIEANVGLSVQLVLLSAFQQDPAQFLHEYDVICTPLYHLPEVREVIGPAWDRVVAVHAAPDRSVLLQAAKLSPETRVGVVCDRPATQQYLVSALSFFHRGPIQACLLSEGEKLREMVRSIDVLVDTPSCHGEIARVFPALAILTMSFRIDVESLHVLRERVAGLPIPG